ncbi:hypothetical protein M426DRAFT_8234 [Hypoxylon sp. CI-4A]|nr:hypothetical protein M426DRAFT_8234 [Hypoxylon sp. CI-4A]
MRDLVPVPGTSTKKMRNIRARPLPTPVARIQRGLRLQRTRKVHISTGFDVFASFP